MALDRNFFASGHMVGRPSVRGVAGEKNGDQFSRVKMFPHQQNVITDEGVAVPKSKKKRGDKKKAAAAAAGADLNDKKHFKVRREKKRSGRGYDD
jgi:large subunit GTPase 1